MVSQLLDILFYEKLNSLERIKCFKPGGAFYAFPNISDTNMTGKQFADLALEKYGVAVVPGNSFGDSINDFIRLSYANSIENIEKAIYRLSKI